MELREHLFVAASHLWAAYEEATLLNHFSALLAVRSQLDIVLSCLESIDEVVTSDA